MHSAAYVLVQQHNYFNNTRMHYGVMFYKHGQCVGTWTVPKIIGQRPPPMAWFTMNSLPHNRMQSVIFGGYAVTEKALGKWTSDLYIITFSMDRTIVRTVLLYILVSCTIRHCIIIVYCRNN